MKYKLLACSRQLGAVACASQMTRMHGNNLREPVENAVRTLPSRRTSQPPIGPHPTPGAPSHLARLPARAATPR